MTEEEIAKKELTEEEYKLSEEVIKPIYYKIMQNNNSFAKYGVECYLEGYNKAKEEMQEQGLALQSDMDKTIEQNIALKKQIEKMKCCSNCDNWNWKHNKCEKKLKGDVSNIINGL